MSSDPIDSVAPQTTPTSGGVSDAARADAQRQQVKRLAEEFEALLMSQMMRDMRQSMVSEDRSGGFGADVMSDTVDIELSRALSRVGGFGLSSVLMRAIERQTGTPGATGAAAVPGIAPAVSATPGVPASEIAPATEPVAPLPANVPAIVPAPAPALAPDAVRRDMPGPITSGYGWRHDPITGASEFHNGVDVAMAYGTDVRAAGSGRVVFSGVNGGYGNMVIVEHGGGQQTRYAHLSALNVQTGASVQSGQVIGRVGSTGHSTGPHLHFEVTDNGRSVNPLVAIKGEPTSAD